MRPALEVARREIADNLATWKIPLAFALTTLLLVTGVLSLAASHDDAVEGYQLVQGELAAEGREDSAEALAHRVFAGPNPLALLVGGPAEVARESFATPPSVGNGTADLRQDPVRLRFAPTDLGTVGVGVLSLLALLFSYDGLAGEKERGTLKMLLVNPLARRDVLLGKWLGAMASLLMPLGGAMLVALLALRATGIRLQGGEWARLLLVLVFLVLLLSAFVLLGLAVSAMTHRASVAILALLLLWVVLVAGAGSLAAFAAKVDSDARGLDEVLGELQVLHADYDERSAGLAHAIADLEERNVTQGGLSPQDAARLEGLRRELARLPSQRQEDQQALLASWFRGADVDYAEAERLAALSPAESFRSVAQALARTDYPSVRDRLDAFAIYLREIETYRAERQAEGEDDPPLPAFRHPPVTVGSDLARASPFAVALLLQNVALFALAAATFGRYDVR